MTSLPTSPRRVVRAGAALALAVVLAGGTGALAPRAQAAPAKTTPKVTITAPAQATVGATVAFRGKVTGRSARATVVLQRRTPSGWVKVRTAKVAASKKYVIRTKARTGKSVYRVTVRATSKIRTARSRTVTLVGRRVVTQNVSAEVRRILADTNAFRAREGRAPLTLDPAMTTVATGWSTKMARTGDFKHNPHYATQIPDGWTGAAENVAVGQSVTSVVRAWINSPGHRSNLLGNYTHIGIGVARSTYGTPYYTQVFARYLGKPGTTPAPEPEPELWNPDVSASDIAAAITRVLSDTNAFRREQGLAELEMDPEMSNVAQKWSESMARAGRLSHNPSYSTQIPSGWRAAAENVASGYAPSAVVDGWIASSGHRDNLTAGHTHIGVGVAFGASGRPYYTQVFATYPQR